GGNTSNESTTTNKVENETINDQLDEIATLDEITNETTEESKDKLEETTTTDSQVEAEESKNGNNIIAYIGVGIAAIAGVLFAKGKKDE
ncbi:MAG: LPXTG cell wall anchor domain-containing protein, partial [Romboutsia timonensis]